MLWRISQGRRHGRTARQPRFRTAALMTDYVEIAQRGDIPAEHGLTVMVDHAAVALFAVAGQLFAMDAACLCCGSDVGAGTLNSTHVVCSGCGWQYDLASGCVQGVAGL